MKNPPLTKAQLIAAANLALDRAHKFERMARSSRVQGSPRAGARIKHLKSAHQWRIASRAIAAYAHGSRYAG